MEKRMQEIRERLGIIAQELMGEVTEERMGQLETEQTELASELNLIERKMNLQGKLRSLEPEEEPVPANPEAVANQAEERAKEIMQSGQLTISAAETRSALQSVTRATLIGSGGIAKPTEVGTVIRDNMERVSSIVDQVYAQDLTGVGSFEEVYLVSGLTANEKEDNGNVGTESNPVMKIAEIKPTLFNVTTYVSKNINRVSPLAYEEKIRSLALKALRKKTAALICNGDTKLFNGIKTAKNKDGEKIYKTLSVADNKIKDTTLRDIVFSYGGSDELGGNARLYLTKEDLAAFGAVRGTNEKKPVYEITADPGNANTGTIKDGGTIVPYTICSELTSLSTAKQTTKEIQTMLYGDPMNFELGLFGDYTIEVSRDYKFAEGLLSIVGEVMIGGNLIVHEGFVVVELAKTGG